MGSMANISNPNAADTQMFGRQKETTPEEAGREAGKMLADLWEAEQAAGLPLAGGRVPKRSVFVGADEALKKAIRIANPNTL